MLKPTPGSSDVGDDWATTSTTWFSAPGLGQTLQGEVYTTGLHRAQCVVTVTDGHLNKQYSDDDDYIVIGGDLKLSVYDAQLPTYARDDGRSDTPGYLQYFGHDPVAPPALAQLPQKGTVEANFGQPAGTSVQFSCSGGQVVSISNTTMRIAATGPTAPGGIIPSAIFTATYEGATLTAGDCSGQTLVPQKYRFTGHAPQDVSVQTVSNGPIDDPSAYGWRRQEQIRLFDHLGKGMPGVFVQEHFTEVLPSNFQATPAPYTWQTVFSPLG